MLRVMPFHADVNKLLMYTEGNKSYKTYIKVDHAADSDHFWKVQQRKVDTGHSSYY